MDDAAFAHALDALNASVLDVQDALEHAISVHGTWADTELKLTAWRASNTHELHSKWLHPGLPGVLQRGADTAHEVLAKQAAMSRLRQATDTFLAALDPLLLVSLQALPSNGVHAQHMTAFFTFTPHKSFAQLRAAPVQPQTSHILWTWDSRAFHFALRTIHTRKAHVGRGPWWELSCATHMGSSQAAHIQAVDAETALAWMAATEIPELLSTLLPTSMLGMKLSQVVEDPEALVSALRGQM